MMCKLNKALFFKKLKTMDRKKSSQSPTHYKKNQNRKIVCVILCQLGQGLKSNDGLKSNARFIASLEG